jgi:DNA-binding NarL/FixJ family response regulator
MSSGADRPAPLRVLVVDGDDRVRASLIGLLAIGDRLEVVGDAGSPTTARDVAADTRPDVIVIDPRLPELEQGRACIRRLRAAVPGVRIIALTCPDSTGDDGLDGLVDAAVRKTFRPGQLQEAVLAAGVPVAH